MPESMSLLTLDRPRIVTAATAAVKHEFKVIGERGLSASACTQLIKLFNQFEGRVTVSNGKTSVDGRSLVGLIRLAAITGTVLTVELIGPGAELTMQQLAPFLANGL